MRVSTAIEGYLHRKRANGLAYKTQESILSEFRRYVSDPLIAEVTPKQVIDFLNIRHCSNGRWMARHSCLRMFFEFWTDRGHMSALSMPQPKRRDSDNDRRAVPFIYTQTELRRLIQATHGNQAHGLCVVSEKTFRTVLLTLYGTGATTSEIFWLRRDDLDLKSNLVLLRGDRITLRRRVPLNKDLHELLVNYLRSEERRSAPGPHVFVSKRGGPLPAHAMMKAFARLRIRAGLVRVDRGVRQPRMLDLRQTFAVHRITSWIEEGADLNRMLPALSAYMGFARFASIQRFLRMTPERFKRELDELSPYRSRKHWRDDPELMRFLASL